MMFLVVVVDIYLHFFTICTKKDSVIHAWVRLLILVRHHHFFLSISNRKFFSFYIIVFLYFTGKTSFYVCLFLCLPLFPFWQNSDRYVSLSQRDVSSRTLPGEITKRGRGGGHVKNLTWLVCLLWWKHFSIFISFFLDAAQITFFYSYLFLSCQLVPYGDFPPLFSFFLNKKRRGEVERYEFEFPALSFEVCPIMLNWSQDRRRRRRHTPWFSLKTPRRESEKKKKYYLWCWPRCSVASKWASRPRRNI